MVSAARSVASLRYFLVALLCCISLALAALPQPVAAQSLFGGGSSSSDSGGDAASAPLQSLLDVLKDDKARQELITELESVVKEQGGSGNGDGSGSDSSSGSGSDGSSQDGGGQDGSQDGSGQQDGGQSGDGQSGKGDGSTAQTGPQNTASIGTRVAEWTQEVAQSAAASAANFYDSLTSGSSILNGLSGQELTVLWETLRSLLLVIVITVAVFLALRTLFQPVFRRMGERVQDTNIIRTLLLFGGSLVLDAMTVIVAWGLGYAIAVLALGDYGQMGFRQALYLNAFLIVELIKVAIRAIVSPSAGGLRLINLSNRAAKRLMRHLNVVVSVMGYGQLLILPVVNRNISFAAGNAVSAVLSLFVLLYLVVLVIRHRDNVANWIARRIKTHEFDEDEYEETVADKHRLTGPLAPLVRNWHWFALIYLAVMFVVVMTRPATAVADLLTASGKVALAVLIGSVIVGALGRALSRGITLPDELRKKLPLLEHRLNAIVPKILVTLRILVSVAVLVYALSVMGLLNFGAFLGSDRGLSLSGAVVSVVLILLVAFGIWLAFNSWIDYRLNPDYGTIPSSRETTLLSLLRNAVTIGLLILTLMFCLSEIGINIGPLLASAGVLGLAIGFGAQKMVQDIITGVFIQLDNAMNVGDVVTVGGTTGTVDKLTVRSVSLRAVDGTYHIIPFSSVDMVSNYMRDFSYHVADMGIAYREDIDEAKTAMLDAFETLRGDEDQGGFILDDLEWFGVQTLGDSAVVLRARIKTVPGKQWGIGRLYNELLKKLFDERGIEIPFPHQTLFFGEDKKGRTQVLRLSQERSDDEEVEGSAEEVSEETTRDAKSPTMDTTLDDDDVADLDPGDGR
ncbi:mechanosensitive ion channel domain-containing protein [Litorisediminicola beolgyonensis]|uniref:Mechanosensitive ion channel domain-containing protein n=1 Tax=Litorisediminicola beolgyonensis TaxID=1173614 RepID=A0ABW3ZMP8_9RHOB